MLAGVLGSCQRELVGLAALQALLVLLVLLPCKVLVPVPCDCSAAHAARRQKLMKMLSLSMGGCCLMRA
jgi:hypothetical protein